MTDSQSDGETIDQESERSPDSARWHTQRQRPPRE